MSRFKHPLMKAIPPARHEIENLFLRQCRYGQQAQDLRPAATACGQFVGVGAETLRQRGLYGTAAAIAVLARSSSTDAAGCLAGLIDYVRNRSGYESDRPGQLAKDEQNIIKTSELLYALTLVKPAVAGREELIALLAQRLLACKNIGGGWPYFADQADADWEMLPTSYALRALHAWGYDVREPMTELLRRLRGAGSTTAGGTGADIAVEVLALYSIWSVNNGDASIGRVLRSEVKRRWKVLERLMEVDIEQNVEYWRGNETGYVRVPWQLYLMSLLAQLLPYRAFAGQRLQGALARLLRAITTAGFRYPHSGKLLSARTNAIAYEVLGDIERSLKPYPLYLGPFWFDALRNLLASRMVAVIAGGTGLFLIGWSTVRWFAGGGEIVELAPDLIAGAILSLLSLRRP